MNSIVKEVKKSYLTAGIVTTIITVLIAVLFVAGLSGDVITIKFIMIFDIIPLLLSTYFLLVFSNPLKFGPVAKKLKKRPDLLELFDYHYSNIMYEDKYYKISDRFITSKKNIYELVSVEEVFLIYDEPGYSVSGSGSVAFITVLIITFLFGGWILVLLLANFSRSITIKCARGKLSVSFGFVSSSKLLNELNTLSSFCRNARMGKSRENERIYIDMCKRWKEDNNVN